MIEHGDAGLRAASACSIRTPNSGEARSLWGEGVRKAFTDMGAIGFADVDSEAVLAEDQRVAERFDASRFEHGPAA